MTAKLITPPTEAQAAIIHLLEEAMREARDGNITTIGIVACMKSGFAAVMAGHAAADLNLGCDDLKRRILEEVTGGNRKRPEPTIIHRPGRG